MISISLCMIVRDEEDVLDRCLNSVKDLVDEIIIVDTGSKDSTKKIARKYTDKIYDFIWIDNFSKARNFAFSKGTKDYLMWLDADDIILEEDAKKFKNMKIEMEESLDYVTMIYNIKSDKNGSVILRNRRIRLMKRENNYKWYGAVHEYIKVESKQNFINSNVCITHDKIKSSGDRNLRIYEDIIAENKELLPRDIYCYANELLTRKKYEEAIKYYRIFLEKGKDKSNLIEVCGRLADCYLIKKDLIAAREYCYRSFEYDVPRAEACCKLGYYFFQENKIDRSIYWYKAADNMTLLDNMWGFVNEACWTYLPQFQLAMCYLKKGDIDSAKEYLNKAKETKPNDEGILDAEKIIDNFIKYKEG